MRNDLNRLVQAVSDPNTKRVCPTTFTYSLALMSLVTKIFDMEMQSFFYLFTRYLTERAKSQDLYAIPTYPCLK
jgi:UTP--glucose-1-phosphate uridylyltransferase